MLTGGRRRVSRWRWVGYGLQFVAVVAACMAGIALLTTYVAGWLA